MSERKPESGYAVPSIGVGEQFHRFTHRAMACIWEAWILGHKRDYAHQAAQAAFDEVDRLEQELSRFMDAGDVARINGMQAGESVVVGIDMFACLELAANIRAETNGAFDVTACCDSTAWKTRPCHPSLRGDLASGPDDGLLSGLKLERSARRVTLAADGVRLDLGGIGKGVALDQMVHVLRDWSIESAIVHSGQSTLFALGTAPNRSHWTIGIRDPGKPSDSLGFIELSDQALSGSGAALHGSHIVDPRTGEPANGALAAWALAPSASVADALSTAFMVMSETEMAAYCDAHPQISALRLIRDRNEGSTPTSRAAAAREAPDTRGGCAVTIGSCGVLIPYGAGVAFVDSPDGE